MPGLPATFLRRFQIVIAACIASSAADAARISQSGHPVRELAYVSTRSGKATIWLSDESGGNARELTPNHPGTIDIGWSPDGETMLFATQLSGNLEMHDLDKGLLSLHAMDMKTGVIRQLTRHDALYRYPEMSPDGKKVIFLSDKETRERQVWVMNSDGSDQTRITGVPGHKSRPTFSPDGSLIAIQIDNPSAQIYLMNPDGSGLKNISNNDFSDRYPSWSGDGRQLTFTSIRQVDAAAGGLLGRIYRKIVGPIARRIRHVWLMNSDGSEQKLLTELDAESKHADFSCDGEAIAFESDLTGTDQIYVTDSAGNNPRQITSEGTNFKPVFRPRPAVGKER